MTNDEAINVLMARYLNPTLNKNEEVDPAYNEAMIKAIAALHCQQANEFETVDSVRVSKYLAALLKPYSGCPRGPIGPCGGESAIEILHDAKKYIIEGPDDRFICVPEWDYEACLKALEKQEAGNDD